jgi:hypothetical protein
MREGNLEWEAGISETKEASSDPESLPQPKKLTACKSWNRINIFSRLRSVSP